MKNKPIIEIKGVWKTYQLGEVSVSALRGLDLTVFKGEFLTVLGPSGSGKSTAMNIIGALDTPTKGKVLLDGINISELSESDLAQLRGKKIGFVFQTFNLIPSLSALENVMLPMVFQSVGIEARYSRARALLERVGLGHRLTHRPNELSGGERQRVAIARALANDPEVILADEPTGNLDSKTGREVMLLFDELNRKDNKTVIMVTHDQDLVKHSERTCYLRDGIIVKVTTSKRDIKK